MALLEKINSMRQTGMSEVQILNALKEEGITPREINEAFSQLKIKSAVAEPQENQEMQPSMTGQAAPEPNQGQAQYQGQYTDQQQYAQPYDQQQYQQTTDQGYYSQTIDLETVRDIATQEIEEANKKIKTEIESLNKTKTDLSFEVQAIENRVAKIESIIQELQTAIIRKMGEYGEAVSSISQELKDTQESFSKVINPLLDKKRGINQEVKEEKIEGPEEQKSSKPKKQEKPTQMTRDTNSAGFEEYFR